MGLGWQFFHMRSMVQCGLHRYHIFGSKDKDSADALKGMTAGGALLDETTLMDDHFITMVITRCSLSGSKIVCSTNPDIPAHPFKVRYIDKVDQHKGIYYQFGFDDNPVLDPEYVEQIKNTLTGADYKRFVLGEWAANAGLVHPVYFKEDPDPKIFLHGCFAVVDYATSGIACILIVRIDEEHRSYVVDEQYHDAEIQGTAITDAELVAKMSDVIERNGLDRENTIVLPDPKAASFKQQCRDDGWLVKDVNNDVLVGIKHTNVALKGKKVTVSTKCTGLHSELETYLWDEKACAKGDDRPLKTKKHHGVDCLRYYVMDQYVPRIFTTIPVMY